MRKLDFVSTLLLVFGMSATVLTSCEKTGNDDNNGLEDGAELSGYVTEDMTLAEGNTYYLVSSLQVKAPATLNIEPGVTIIAKDNGEINYILIEQGAKINAVGTASSPVVMTSEAKESGSWGGLHICGKAHTNAGSGNTSEIGNAVYGGDALDESHESNGLSLYGVGSGTTISYVQAYGGADDGIEFFGGSVNIDHCVVTDCSDDSFDWTEGWNGKAEYIVAYQSSKDVLGYDCDCLMECDNNDKNFAQTPVSHPVISKATLVGNGSADNKRGVRLRAGTQVELRDALILGKAKSITLETEETVNSILEGVSILSNISVDKELVNEENDAYGNTDFQEDGNLSNQAITLKNKYVGIIDGKGAVSESEDWTASWTK